MKLRGEAVVSAREWALVVAVMAGGFGGSATDRLINPPRPDPFTGAEARELRTVLSDDLKDLKRIIVADIELRLTKMKMDFRESVPPEPVRQRMIALERAVGILDPEFRPPTTQWR